MGIKVKAQTAPIAIPAPAIGGQGQSLFADEQPDTTETETHRFDQVAAVEPPPDVQLQHANRFGHRFGQTAVADYVPTHTAHSALQANADGSFQAGQGIENRLKSRKGGGQPLPPDTLGFMESRFDNDFSRVKVHTDTEAVQMNQNLQARAFTHGEDIYFNSGHYNPQSQTGKRLLAHELTHTIQQTGAKVKPKRLPEASENSIQQKSLKGGDRSPSIQREYQDEGISLKPLAATIQRDYIDEGISLKPLTETPVSPVFIPPPMVVSPLVQPKLMVGAPGDKYEQEADRVADRVVSMTLPTQPVPVPEASPIVQPQAVQTQTVQPQTIQPDRLTASTQNIVQRDEAEDIERDKTAAAEQIKQELDAKRQEGGDVSAGEASGKAAQEQGQKLEDASKQSPDKEAAEKQAENLSGEAEHVTKQEQTKTTQEQEKNQKTVQQEQQKDEQTGQQDKQKDETAAEQAEPKVEGETPALEEQPSTATPEDALLPLQNKKEGLTDPGAIQIPGTKADKAPATADDDPAFQSVAKQTEHIAAEQSQHKPATDKAREAQEAAVDPNQQTRSAQATQTATAGSKTPSAFNREAFISSLMSVLESSKPQSQEEIEQGKGASGATEGMKQQVAESKQAAGGGLPEAAQSPADPGAEMPKTTTPTPEAQAEAGEPPKTEAIDASAATPKPKTEQEIEKPLQETAKSLDELVPKKLQTKLMVGAPGDKYEQEADRMADRVMNMPDSQPSTPEPIPQTAKPNKIQSAKQTESESSPYRKSQVESASLPAAKVGSAIAQKSNKPNKPSPSSKTNQNDKNASVGRMVQLAPGMFIQMEALTAQKPTQEGNEVQIDQNRLDLYQKESGVNVEGPITEAKQHFSESAPQQYRTAETQIHQDTQQQQQQTGTQANQEMFATRQQEFQNVQGTQTVAQQKDEAERARISQDVQGIYDQTKTNVNTVLTRMDQRVEAEFAATNALARTRFEATQKQLFQAWKQDYYYNRHPFWFPAMQVKVGWAYVKVRFYLERYFNTPLWLVNKVFTGLPDEVNQIYVKAREVFVEEQKKGVYRIADIVEEELANAKAAVDQGRQQVTTYINGLPENLKAIGTEAAAAVQSQFDQLEQTIQNRQQQLVDQLKAKYEASLKEIDQRIENLKAANQSFVSKALSALGKLATWVLRRVIGVIKPWLEKIPGIGSQVGKFLDAFADNPGKFMSNLFKGIGDGFKNFAKNALTHLKTAVFTWLFGAGIDIKLPDSFDLKGILDIILQIFGLSKDYIFELAGNFFPEWAMELIDLIIEKGASAFSEIEELLTDLEVPQFVFSFFKALISFPAEGFMAIWEFIKGFFSSLKIDFIMTLITDLLLPEMVVAGVQWLIGLLNPAAGIIKIVKAVVDVISFFIDNIDSIKTLLESIGATLDAVISGAVGMIASAVEGAIAAILPTMLGLLASLLGIGGIPKKITKVIKKLRAPVDKGLGKIFSTIGGLLPGGKKGKKGKRSKKGKNGKPKKDNPQKRLKAASNEVQGVARKVRDPEAVEAKLGSIQKRHKLTSLKLKKSGKKKYRVVGQAKPIKGGKAVQRQAIDPTHSIPDLEPQTEDSIQRAEGQGEVMPNRVRSEMENSLEQDFGEVRLHTDAEGDRLSRSLDAQAFTMGQDIFFRQGAYNPEQPEGKRLLAHELTHVTQQRQGLPTAAVQRKKTDWKDQKKTVVVKKKLKGSKRRGGKFTVTAKLMDPNKILPKVAKKLSAFIEKSPDPKKVKRKLQKLKSQYNLKSLRLIRLNKEGTRYKIEGTAPADGKGTAQRSPQQGAAAMEMAGGIETAIQRAQERGQALSPAVQQPMENAFGIDFGNVRIHTDPESDRLNRSMQAHAFTTGQDIFFRQGTYNPGSRGGQRLLAHELTHVVQQAGETPVMATATTDRFFPSAQRQSDAPSPLRLEQPQIQRLAMGGASLGGLFGSNDKVNIDKKVTKSVLLMNVTVEKSKKKAAKKPDKQEKPKGLPPELIGEIVKVIQGIVNQDPNPDVVAQKLDKVRAEFGLDLVKLASYAAIRDNYEYTIKIQGNATGMDEGAVVTFLKRLAGGGHKADAVEDDLLDDNNQRDHSKQNDRPLKQENEPKSALKAEKSPESKTKTKQEAESLASREKPSDMNQEDDQQEYFKEPKLKDFSKSSEQDKDDEKENEKKLNDNQPQIDVNTVVRRIDEQSIDLIVKADPKSP